jgi:hypothetical protein
VDEKAIIANCSSSRITTLNEGGGVEAFMCIRFGRQTLSVFV